MQSIFSELVLAVSTQHPVISFFLGACHYDVCMSMSKGEFSLISHKMYIFTNISATFFFFCSLYDRSQCACIKCIIYDYIPIYKNDYLKLSPVCFSVQFFFFLLCTCVNRLHSGSQILGSVLLLNHDVILSRGDHSDITISSNHFQT